MEKRVRTYLEMTSANDLVPASGEAVVTLALLPAHDPDVRILTLDVGAPFGWPHQRWDDALWDQYLADPTITHYRLQTNETTIGVVSINIVNFPVVEIDTFGLLPQFVGHGCGGVALTTVVRTVWNLGATRIWLHTSNADHPHALPNYLARGFRTFAPESS